MTGPALQAEKLDHLRESLEVANLPSLLMVLVQLTGNLQWMQEPFLPTRSAGISDNDDGGFPPEVQRMIRDAAFDAISEWKVTGDVVLPRPSYEMLRQMLSVTMGEEVPLEYAPMVAQELGIDDEWDVDVHTRAPEGFTALIVGAGAAGICAAVKFAERGITYRIIEKNHSIGGTWFENRYPGTGVDTPSHLYSFSFAKHDWPLYFSKGPEIRDYLQKVADEFGVTANVTFDCRVVEAAFDNDSKSWVTTLEHSDGRRETVTSNLLVSAVGALNTPKIPTIDGLDSFEGPSFHTARWPSDVSVAGKKVGIIGTGASAMQIVPAIADDVERLEVFQRSPQWATPFDKLDVRVPSEIHTLMHDVPLYEAWYRVRLGWTFNDRTYSSLQRDPDWPHPDRSINAANDGHRRYFTRYIESELGDRQDLLPGMLPDYPPFGKRILMDHGWFRTFLKDNVDLITERVTRVNPRGVVTSDGVEHLLDILVLSTGFDAVRFVSSMSVRGAHGLTLREAWDDDNAQAYLGTVVPGFPNFFTLYGPNLQLGHGGSLLYMLENQTHYALSLLETMFAKNAQSFDVRQDVHDSYNKRVDEANAGMIWTHPGVDNYYKNTRGRVVVNMALRVIDYWNMSRRADPAEFEFGYAR